jgi:rhomboid protease GluP
LCWRLRNFDRDDVHFAPNIPEPVLAAAAQRYLALQDDEVLVAIVGVKKEGSSSQGCALTTQRIYWPGRWRHPAVAGPRRCHRLDYASLPDRIKPGGLGSTIDLGQGRLVRLRMNQPLRDALIDFLKAVRALARGDGALVVVPESERASADRAWPLVAAACKHTLAVQSEIQAFQGRTEVVARPVLTLVLAFACFAVFVAMVAGGVSPVTPSGQQLLAWGANFGPLVVFNDQLWRLGTAMFLHIGLFHLVMNMYCLLTAGPVVERFFGHIGFALLYVLSGIGGSLASLWAHPTLISAGASGAIFGIFGGLLGFLAIQHRNVPLVLLKPMRAGAIAFVAYNTLFSLGVPEIDMAAHLGGLATGFVCGLLMSMVSPALAPGTLGWGPPLRRTAMAAVLALALAELGTKAIAIARAGILADPKMGPLVTSELRAAPAFNAFFTAANPVLLELDRIAEQIDAIAAGLDSGTLSQERATQMLRRLQAECRSLEDRITAIAAQNTELQAIRSRIAAAQTQQAGMLKSIDRFVTSGDESQIRGPAGLKASADAYVRECKEIGNLRDAYIRTHGLKIVPSKGGPQDVGRLPTGFATPGIHRHGCHSIAPQKAVVRVGGHRSAVRPLQSVARGWWKRRLKS